MYCTPCSTLGVKYARTIVFILVSWTFATTGAATPFSNHCLDCCLVSIVYMVIGDSSIVMTRSRIDLPSFHTR